MWEPLVAQKCKRIVKFRILKQPVYMDGGGIWTLGSLVWGIPFDSGMWRNGKAHLPRRNQVF